VDTVELEKLAPAGLRPLRRAEYDRLVEAGAFDGERLELIHGRIVRMSPQGALHYSVVNRLLQVLLPALLGRAMVACQSPLALGESEPEPDLSVLPLSPDTYAGGLPDSAFLVIEVADSSLAYDTRVKSRLYAEAGIPEFWLFDVQGGRVLVHRAPSAAGYAAVEEIGPGGLLIVPGFADVQVAVDAVLPRAR
jgi:Uma2 family endonuclease